MNDSWDTNSEPNEGLARVPTEYRTQLQQAHHLLEHAPLPPSRRLPVWVAAACLGAGLLATPACGGTKEKEIVAPPGLETALMKPEPTVMEPELESLDPMDPVPGQVKPPPGSMEPLPPPTRGADRRPDLVSGLPGDPSAPGFLRCATLEGLGIGGTYGAPPIGGKSIAGINLVQVVLTGKLDPNEVRAVLRAHRHEMHHCYMKGLMQDAKLAGTVRLSFVVNKTGRPQDCRVEENLPMAAVGDCFCTRLMTWKFPQPSGGLAKVSATWSLQPQSD
ncbi:MAG: hypothetical protein CVU65_14255 [Deltaproteobacteria bacterium HGW-Deltaproteobacteria-22]|nr:MAG: hypothetical protein CVU65_14255 [Deltaproteobacteria bacterium HGW-Deltaproteobacteria-22]